MVYVIGIVAALIILFGFLCYKKAPPTEAIVVTGFGLSKPKVVCGKGTFVLPVLQRADRLNMRLLKIDVKTPETGVKTKNGVSLWIDSVVTIQVYSENSTVLDEEVKASGLKDAKAYIMSRQQAAISNFLGMNEQGINEKVNDVLQGNLREIVSDMTVDQILTNRKQMAVSVIENARPDLAKMGLEVVTFNVQDIRDAVDVQGHNHGVIEAIGIEQEELVKKQAEIARAQAARDVACAKADAEMAANAKEVEAQTAIAKRNNELQLAKAKLKAEADKAAADADAAGQIQMNLRAKEIKEAEADAEIAKQKKMVDLAAQEAEVQQRKLDAEVRKQADADLYRRQKEAEAKKYEAERAAEAQKFSKQQEAEGIELVGKAEAEAIRQKGLAEAEAMKQKAEAYKQYNDAAVAEMLIKVLPDIAKSVAQPLSSIDKVSIIGGDASGVSGVSGNVPILMAQTMQTVKEATGIDMGEIVRANSIQAKTDRNINIMTQCEQPENGDIRNAQTQCRIMLEKNVPEKDARFKENELRKLNLLKPELIQLPANLENLLIAEDATNFPESRFLLREEEETVINKLLATRKAALAIKELGIHYTCSLLLTGLPGVGKTELARYIAHKANLPFVFLKFSGLVNSALGRTQQNIGRVFDYAKRTPCVLCVDEIDAIGMCRGSRDDVAEMSRVTIALMQELDRLPNDVILIGTTNRVDNLDEALIRRFTFKHRVKPLGDDDMKELCKKFLASADYPFTESELDELCHSLREQRTASAVVNACTERIVAHIVSQLPENSADAV